MASVITARASPPDVERQPPHVLRAASLTPGAFYDQRIADRAVQFFERFLRHYKGEFANRPFRLEPWQQDDFIRPLFGWKRPDGSRLFRRGALWTARKNGKTIVIAGSGALCLAGDNEPGCEVYSIASKADQATLSFDDARAMISASPALTQKIEVFKTKIVYPEIGGKWAPLSGKPRGKHGLNPHVKIGDELHEWDSGDIDDFVRQGMAARRQPIELDASTAGDVRGYGHDVFQRDIRIRDGTLDDPETLVAIYAAGPDDDWRDPATWRKANPNLGVSVKHSFLESEARKAADDPAKETHFRRYHLNQWTQAGTRWIQAHVWAECARSPGAWRDAIRIRRDLPLRSLVDPSVNPPRHVGDFHPVEALVPEALRGRPAFAGVDLSSNSDYTAVTWVFPAHGSDPHTVLLPRLYIPEAKLAGRSKKDRVSIPRWLSEGAVICTEGNTVDYERVLDDILATAPLVRLQRIGLDRKFAGWIGPKLVEAFPQSGDDDTVVYVNQSFVGMGPGYKELERLMKARLLDHLGHPVLKWMASNVAIVEGRDGDILAIKDKSADRIDGIVAAAMAMALAVGAAQPEGDSVYETRGVIAF